MKAIARMQGFRVLDGKGIHATYEVQVHNGVITGGVRGQHLDTEIEIRSTKDPTQNIVVTYRDLADALKVVVHDLDNSMKQ